MIALRARRTAHQVASSLYLHQHTKSLLRRCTDCGKEFVPDHRAQHRCPECPLPFLREYVAPDAGPEIDEIAAQWNACWAGIFVALAVILTLLGLVIWSVKADLARAFGF